MSLAGSTCTFTFIACSLRPSMLRRSRGGQGSPRSQTARRRSITDAAPRSSAAGVLDPVPAHGVRALFRPHERDRSLMTLSYDFHIHTSLNGHSDPAQTVPAIGARAEALGLEALAITEHVVA